VRRRGEEVGGGRETDFGTAEEKIAHLALVHPHLQHLERDPGERGVKYVYEYRLHQASANQPNETRGRRTLTARKI
jgi:hypothetical protein